MNKCPSFLLIGRTLSCLLQSPSEPQLPTAATSPTKYLHWREGDKRDNFIGFSFFPVSSSEFLIVLLKLFSQNYLHRGLFSDFATGDIQPRLYFSQRNGDFFVVPVNMTRLYFRLMWPKRYRNFMNITWTLGYFPNQ